jgi:uridine phosphorylase
MFISVNKLVAAAVVATLTAGCASIADQDAIETERRLAAAGFQMKLANTPEKMEQLNRLGQRRLVPMEKDGATVFVYADGKGCKCVYVGSQQNYQEYERLSIQQNVVDEQRQTAQNMNMAVTNATMNWDMWGAWPRPIFY